jgi:hypothetical protein
MDSIRDGVRDLSQLPFVLAKFLFRRLALVNVYEKDAPTNDAIVGIPDRQGIVMKPAIRPSNGETCDPTGMAGRSLLRGSRSQPYAPDRLDGSSQLWSIPLTVPTFCQNIPPSAD